MGNSLTTDLGLLGVRLVTGGLLAGHGAQKLFGSFGGHGMKGTAGWLESIGMKPGGLWAAMAGASEFGGGLLTAAGLLSPVGPITMLAPMAMATRTVHADKPIWSTAGGPELPVINMAVATGLVMSGPGRFSVDSLLGVKLPFWLVAIVSVATAAGVYVGLSSREQPQASEEAAPAGDADAAPAGTETGTGTSGAEHPAGLNGATVSSRV
jgi:putative oxidoreductase